MIATFALALLSTLPAADEGKKAMDTRCYEMRVYYSPPGKLEDLHARFRNHTLKLFEKHGMTNVGYWVPVDNKENKLIYILSYPSREARETSWKAFMADPDWQKAWKESEKNGTLVVRFESLFLKATDYSPEIKAAKGSDERVFELRTYKAAPGKLKPLHARFRDHTVKLFAKHSCIDVRKDCAERLIQISKGAQLRGRNFILDYDRGPKSAQQDGPQG